MLKRTKRRNTNRISQHDYSVVGYYFITICAENRQQIFGTIENNRMVLNDGGEMVNFWWQEMVKQYPNISIDQYVIMPNHIHGIINIVGVDLCVDQIQNDKILYNAHAGTSGRTRRSAPTISVILQWFKTMTTNKYIQNVKNNNWPSFDKRLWQRNFYDHIIRDDKSLNEIREYIRNNPTSWQHDNENPNKIDNIKMDEIIV